MKDFVTANKTAKNPLLIFDQFEEILRTNPTDTAGQKEFFRQLGDLLALPHIWALIIIREDFLAPLLPFFATLPTHLRHRYRLNLFTPAQAESCMRGLAAKGEPQRTFQPDALAELTANLSTAIVQSLDGKKKVITGSNVEPMQMQVVCHRLWNGMDEDDTVIDLIDVQKHADVVASLGAYYDEAITGITGQHQTPERAIRDWFSRKLITRDETRGQVQKGEFETEGLPTAIVEAFVAKYIVRVEERRTTRWYELAHDSLVRPILKANADWRTTNLTHAQKAADTWAENGKPDGLLLSGDDLTTAQSWKGVYTPVEHEFLDRSARRQAIEDAQKAAAIREAEQNQKLRKSLRLVIAVSVVALLLAGAAWVSYNQAKASEAAANKNATAATVQSILARISAGFAKLSEAEADKERRNAVENLKKAQEQEHQVKLGLSAQSIQDAARSLYEQRPDYALAHYARALRLDPDSVTARHGIADLLLRGKWTLPVATIREKESVRSAHFSPDGRLVLTTAFLEPARLWNAATGAPVGRPIRHPEVITGAEFINAGRQILTASSSVLKISDAAGNPVCEFAVPADLDSYAVSPSGDRLITIDRRRVAVLWTRQASSRLNYQSSQIDTPGVTMAAFHPDGIRFATGSEKGDVLVWKAGTSVRMGKNTRAHGNRLFTLAFSPDGKKLVSSAGSDRTIKVWNPDTGDALATAADNTDVVTATEFNRDGSLLLAASWGGLKIFGPDSMRDFEHSGRFLDAHFSPDEKWVLTASENHAALWNISSNATVGNRLRHEAPVQSAEFSPNGRFVVTASDDGTAKIWDVSLAQSSPANPEFHALAFSADGARLITATEDQIQLRDPLTAEAIGKPWRAPGEVDSLAFHPDGVHIVTAIGKHAQVWHAATGRPASRPLVHKETISRAWFSPNGRYVHTTEHPIFDRVLTWNPAKPAIVGDPEGVHLDRHISDVLANLPSASPAFSLDESLAALSAFPGHLPHISLPRILGTPSATFSRSGNIFASIEAENAARIWLTQSPPRFELSKPLPAESKANHAIFSPNADRLATAFGKLAYIWDVSTRKQIGQPMRMTETIESLAFSPDGLRLATFASGEVQVWNALTGAALGGPIKPDSSLAQPTFSPNGRFIVTGLEGFIIQLWPVLMDNGSAVETALLADLAEAVSGHTVNEYGAPSPVDDIESRRQRLLQSARLLPNKPGTLGNLIRTLIKQ